MNPSETPFVALFPGQGSQFVGMGKALCADFPIAKQVFEEASDAAKKDLRKLCLDGPESDLTLTENTQPCLVTVSIAAFRVAEKELGIVPAATAGHSLGEYSALVAAGALRLDVAVRWVQERGRAMQKAVPAGQGKMAAILGLEDNSIEPLCAQATALAKTKRTHRFSADTPAEKETGEEIEYSVEPLVEAANFNAPGQVVIAGSTDGIQEAIALIQSGAFPGGKAILLPVSAPFHCKLMLPARDRMADLFAGAVGSEKPGALKCAYVPNRTARLNRESNLILELLIDQIDHPVLWKQSVEAMIAQGYTRAIEFGPGKVLQGLSKRIAKPLGKTFETLSMGDTDSLRSLETAMKGSKI